MLKQQHWKHWSNLCEEPAPWGMTSSRVQELDAHPLIHAQLLTPQAPSSLWVECYEDRVEVDLEQGRNADYLSYVSPESGRRKQIRLQDAQVYQPDRGQACLILAQELNAQGTPRAWHEGLDYVGDVRINGRHCSCFLVSRYHQQQGSLEAALDRKVVRSPAILLSTGTSKQPISWPSGWGILLPLQDLFVERPTGTQLDIPLLESEVRSPHRDVRRAIVSFSLSEKMLRIKGIGDFPVPAGPASTIVQRLVEEAWRGDVYVSIQELRDLVGADSGKKFRDLMGGMKNMALCIDSTTVRGHYAIRLMPIDQSA